jgi:hypothetical protein
MLNKHNFVLKYYDVLYGRLSTYQYPLVPEILEINYALKTYK